MWCNSKNQLARNVYFIRTHTINYDKGNCQRPVLYTCREGQSLSKHRGGKNESCVLLADCITLEHGKGFHWTGRTKKKKKKKKGKTHSSQPMGRPSYGELPTCAGQRGHISPAVQMLPLGAGQQTQYDRRECDTCHSQ